MTDPTAAASANAVSARLAIADAAEATGADFEYLMATAARESAFDAGARARTSSASGLFQFIEQTWLAMMSRHGGDHGYGDMAGRIRQDENGRYRVDDAEARRKILDLRFDARAASVMAGELAAENAAVLRAATGREPSGGELYAAHFLGARNAARLLETAASAPQTPADALFPAAAAANRPVFYEDGRALSARALLDGLTGTVAGSKTAMPETVAVERERYEQATRKPDFQRGFAGRDGLASLARPGASLSPMLVEILASLDLPDRARDRTG